MLKQKKIPKNEKEAGKTHRNNRIPGQRYRPCVSSRTACPKKEGAVPRNPSLAPSIATLPEPGRMGGAAPRNKTKENRTKPPTVIWDNKVSPRHLDTLMHSVP